MNSQKQDTSQGALAIQSGRDTNIGLNSDQVCEIMKVLANQVIPTVAKELFDARLTDFRESIIKEFSNTEKTNTNAFKDPDFLFVINKAQYAYGRSGDKIVGETLIDLISRRSKASQRGRLSLTLNEAVEKAAVLTNNEFAELSLCYLFKYTRSTGINNIVSFINYIKDNAIPLIADISKENASYQYIEAHSCGSIGAFSTDFITILRTNYTGIFSRGFDRSQLTAHLPQDKPNILDDLNLIIPCLNDPSKLQLGVLDKDSFKVDKLNEEELGRVWNLFDSTIWNGDDFLVNVEKYLPEIRILHDLWQQTSLKQLSLTTIGIAIGHANLVRLAKLDADLNIWIK